MVQKLSLLILYVFIGSFYEKIFYRFITLILIFTSLLFCLTFYLLDIYVTGNLNKYLWFTFSVLIISGGYASGTTIQKLKRNSDKDYLTGIYNRKHFYNQLKYEITKCKKHDEIISLIMIDIDNFKKINDNYGHLNGDKILSKVAATIMKSIRSSDTIARIGGEEFSVILPNTDINNAYILADRIRNIVENTSFYCDNKLCKITISMGVASLKNHNDVNKFIKLADDALYKAKETKNKVEVIENI